MLAVDQLILEVAGITEGAEPAAATILITEDPSGDLLAAALATGAEVVFCDADYTRSQAAAQRGARVIGDTRLDIALAGSTGTAVAIGRAPKSLARLDYVARSIAGAGFSEVQLVLGGNNKHLSRTMNTTLEESFENVAASRGRGKFRCLVASVPRSVTYTPREANGFVAIGGVFSGPKEDRGGAALRAALPSESVEFGRFLDLGCGNGSVSRGIAGACATDSDADAVLSARAIGIDATWDDAGSRLPDGAFDTIALNPPFHDGTAVDATRVQHLLDAAVRLLAPDGVLYLVHNSHLRYRGEVERRFSTVEQLHRDATFTVLRAS